MDEEIIKNDETQTTTSATKKNEEDDEPVGMTCFKLILVVLAVAALIYWNPPKGRPQGRD